MEVIIIGAGIGGLTLANGLRGCDRLRVRVLERDASVDSRDQGYGIGLSADSGLRVLDTLGLRARAEEFSLPNPKFAFLKPNGKRLMTLDAPSSSKHQVLAVPRAQLRALLLAQVAEQVCWEHVCTAVEEHQEGCVVHLSGGRSVPADVVVACDGAGSAVQAQLFGVPRHYLGLSSLGGALEVGSGMDGIDMTHPLLAGGAFLTLARGASFFTQCYGDSRLIWSYCAQDPERRWTRDSDPVAVRDQVRQQVADWHAPIPALIDRTEPEQLVVRPYFDRLPPKVQDSSRIALLGDAVHPMSPFRGRGANLAMIDALELAAVLKEADKDTVSRALARFQEPMLRRGRSEVLRSRRAAQIFHSRSAVACAMRDTSFRMMGGLMGLAPGRD